MELLKILVALTEGKKEPKVLDLTSSDYAAVKNGKADVTVDVDTEEASTLEIFYLNGKTIVVPSGGFENSDPYCYLGKIESSDVARYYEDAVGNGF